MKIAYCTNVRLPSERAHGHQIAQVCDALVRLGHEVAVFAPIRSETIDQPFSSYYGVSDRIVLRHIGNKRHLPNWPVLRPLRQFLLNAGLKTSLHRLVAGGAFDLLYTRSPDLLPALVESGTPVILELHQLPRRGRKAFVRACNRCALVACLTSHMRNQLVAWGVEEQRVIAEGDAVDIARFTKAIDADAVRQELGLPREKIIVGYVGRLKTLYKEKGVGVLLEALALLKSEKAFMGLIVGGPEEDVAFYREKAQSLGLGIEDVLFTGEVGPFSVPNMLAACDILTMPFPDMPHYRYHMSPLKMFEYMAAGKPIVTSDLPTVRDVLSDDQAFFCAPGDAGSLADMLRHIHAHPKEASRRAEAAHTIVSDHTWESRMKRVLQAAGMVS